MFQLPNFFLASLSLAHLVVFDGRTGRLKRDRGFFGGKKSSRSSDKKPLLFRFSGRVKDDKYFIQIIVGGQNMDKPYNFV